MRVIERRDDADEHGLLALRLLAIACGDDDAKWEDARRAASDALAARTTLWDGVATARVAAARAPTPDRSESGAVPDAARRRFARADSRLSYGLVPMDVARIRKSHGLTQARLAAIVGVHPMTVSKWERGALEPGPFERTILASLSRQPGKGSPAMAELAGVLNRAFIEVVEVESMLLSASNQLRGKIVEIELGPVSTRVVLEIAPKVRVTSVITTASAKRLGLAIGKRATAIIKATEVILGMESKP